MFEPILNKQQTQLLLQTTSNQYIQQFKFVWNYIMFSFQLNYCYAYLNVHAYFIDIHDTCSNTLHVLVYFVTRT